MKYFEKGCLDVVRWIKFKGREKLIDWLVTTKAGNDAVMNATSELGWHSTKIIFERFPDGRIEVHGDSSTYVMVIDRLQLKSKAAEELERELIWLHLPEGWNPWYQPDMMLTPTHEITPIILANPRG